MSLKAFRSIALTAALFCSVEEAAIPEWMTSEFLPPVEKSEAYKRYTRRSPTELAKLFYLLDRFVNTEFKILYNGDAYDANTAVQYARSYLFEHYDHEKADRWIKLHAYRLSPGGPILYLKYPSGQLRPARDVLLEELSRLDHVLHT